MTLSINQQTMPFKIIETTENGQKTLCIIPSLWETNGELRWPIKRLQISKLIKNENSRPLDNWSTSKCCVKRSSLSSYEKALREMELMVENSDTEIDTVKESNTKANTNINFNALAGQLIVNQQEKSLTSPTARTSTQILPEVTTDEQYVIQYIDESGLATTSVDPHRNEFEAQTQKNTDVNQIENYLKLILDNQNNITQKINVLADNQKKVFRKLASLSVQIDDGFSKSDHSKNTGVVTLGDSNPIYSDAFEIKPIDSIKDLEEMESLLSNKNQKRKLLSQYSFLCSQSDGNGVTCAYRILDMFFSREFLCKCSWTGGSRKSEEVKIGLMRYKNVLNFYYELIHTWDKTDTVENNENFFKIVIKNSVKRKLSKNVRASTKRMRAKKTVLKDIDKNNLNQGNQDANQNQMDTNESNQSEIDANKKNVIDVNAANEKENIEEEEEEGLC